MLEERWGFWFPQLDTDGVWHHTAALALERLTREGVVGIRELAATYDNLGFRATWRDAMRTHGAEAVEVVESKLFAPRKKGSHEYAWFTLLAYLYRDDRCRPAVERLLHDLGRSRDRDHRSYSRPLLPLLGDRALPVLRDQLRSASNSDRAGAALGLARIDHVDGETRRRLTLLSRLLDPEVRRCATLALARHGNDSGRAWRSFLEQTARARYSRQDEWGVAARMAEAEPSRWPSLIATIDARRFGGGSDWMQVLVGCRAPAAEQEFRRLLARRRPTSLSQRFSECLPVLTPSGRVAIDWFLAHSEGTPWQAAAHAAARLGYRSREVRAAVGRGLNHEEPLTRLAAARALGVQGERAVRLLRNRLLLEVEPVVRGSILASLARLRGDHDRAESYLRLHIDAAPLNGLWGMRTVVAWSSELSRRLEPEMRRGVVRYRGLDIFAAAMANRLVHHPDRIDPTTELQSVWWH